MEKSIPDARRSPVPNLLYRGVIESFDSKKGFGFIYILSLIREKNIEFEYYYLEPLGCKAFIHFSEVMTDSEIIKDYDHFTVLKTGQFCYFNLTLDKGKYKAVNLRSEICLTSLPTDVAKEVFHSPKKENSNEVSM